MRSVGEDAQEMVEFARKDDACTSSSAINAGTATDPNIVRIHAPIDMGDCGLKTRSMLMKQTRPSEIHHEKNRRKDCAEGGNPHRRTRKIEFDETRARPAQDQPTFRSSRQEKNKPAPPRSRPVA